MRDEIITDVKEVPPPPTEEQKRRASEEQRLFERAQALLRENKLDEAEKAFHDYTAAIAPDYVSVTAVSGLVEIQMRRGKYREAWTVAQAYVDYELERTRAFRPADRGLTVESPEFVLKYAVCLAEVGRPEQAVAAYRAGIEKVVEGKRSAQPALAEALEEACDPRRRYDKRRLVSAAYTGAAADNRSEPDLSVPLLQRALRADPRNALAWYLLGDAQELHARDKESREAFAQARQYARSDALRKLLADR